jgi:hypothetical protein
MTLPSHDPIVVRAADHMVRAHGRHAADFADYRSRELGALGSAEAAALWAAVARHIRDEPAHAAAPALDHCVA